MLPKNRPPSSPGEVLVEEFLKPLGLTQTALAARMGVHVQVVNLIINERRDVTARTAILLSEALGTTPELWLGLQSDRSLWFALQERAEERRAKRSSPVRKAVPTRRGAARVGRSSQRTR